MNSNTVWGALMIAYVIPWAIWTAKREDNAGKDFDKRTTRIGLCLTTGMLLLMLGWFADLNPLGGLILLFGGVVFPLCVGWVLARFIPRQQLRFLLAGSAVWVLGVGAWWLIFRRQTELDPADVVMLASLPPAVAAFGIGALRWAKA